jgi:hypothetical protein
MPTEAASGRYTLRHDVSAVRLSGTPGPDRLVRWYQEHETTHLSAGTRFDLATDPGDVGPPSTLLVLTAEGWFRAQAADLGREPDDTEFADVYAERRGTADDH